MIDTKQPSLFADEAEAAPSLAELVSPDPDALPRLFEVIDGKWVIADDRMAAWAGHTRIEQWIDRHWDELSDLGKLEQSVQVSGARGPRRLTTYLTPKHARHFLNHSRLPHLRPYRKRTIVILSEYEEGNLVSTNAETTIALQDATAEAEMAAPGSTQLGAELTTITNRIDGVDQHLGRFERDVDRRLARLEHTVLNDLVELWRDRTKGTTLAADRPTASGRRPLVDEREPFAGPPNPDFGKGGDDD